MTPTMASFSPGCVEVDISLCPDPVTGVGGETGAEPPPSDPFDGLSQVEVTVLAAEGPLAGAAVEVELFSNQTNATTPALTGTTDGAGKFYFERMAPSPNTLYRWRLTVTPGSSGVNFAPETLDVPARTADIANNATGEPQQFFPEITVCPVGGDSIICDVAQARTMFKAVYEQQLKAWHYESSGRPPQIAAFAADQAHAAVANAIRPKDSRLASGWVTIYSWWIADYDIPLRDWPAIVERSQQAFRIFGSIPFPVISDYFVRCARGIPLYKGWSVGSPRLYSQTFSDYFPREDRQIEADMAYQYLVNLQPILQCVEHKIRQKIKEMERSAKAWRTMGLVATFMLAPLAAGAAPTLLATEVASYTYEAITGEISGGQTEAVVTAGVSVAAANPGAMKTLIASGLTLLLEQNAQDLDPIIQEIAVGAVSEIAAVAVGDVVTQTVATGALDFVSLQSLGSGVAAFAVKMVANMITAQGVKGIDGLKDIILGLQNIEAALAPFLAWAINTLLLDALFDAAAALADQENGELPPGVPLPIDPVTGEPIPPAEPAPIDPVTGEPLPVDPVTGEPIPPGEPGVPVSVDPVTGEPLPVDPVTGEPLPVDPVTGEPVPDEGVPGEPVPTPPDQGPPLSDFDGQRDIIGPIIDAGEAGGNPVPSQDATPKVPVIDAESVETTNLAIGAGVGGAAVVLALVGVGVLGS
jgi:hypothetical protein